MKVIISKRWRKGILGEFSASIGIRNKRVRQKLGYANLALIATVTGVEISLVTFCILVYSVAHFRCCARISNFLQTNCKFFAWNAKYRQSSVNSNFLHQIYCFHPIFEIHEDWKSHGDKSRLWGGCYKTSQFILPSGSWTVFATWDWGLSWDEWHHCCWHTSILRSLHFGQCWC